MCLVYVAYCPLQCPPPTGERRVLWPGAGPALHGVRAVLGRRESRGFLPFLQLRPRRLLPRQRRRRHLSARFHSTRSWWRCWWWCVSVYLSHLRTPTVPVRIRLLTFSWHLTQLCWSVRLHWLWLPGQRIYPRWRRSAFCFIHLYHSCRISRHKLTLLTHPLPPVCQ